MEYEATQYGLDQSGNVAADGIPKRDARGCTIDVHAMRTTFATHLSKGGVAPRTAQAALRHSDLSLTMNVDTDPRLLDEAGALEVLPKLSLDSPVKKPPMRLQQTDDCLYQILYQLLSNLVQISHLLTYRQVLGESEKQCVPSA